MGTQKNRSFEHPKHMLKLIVKKILHLYAKNFVYIDLCVMTANFYLATSPMYKITSYGTVFIGLDKQNF